MVRVITFVRHVGRPVKIRTTFAPAPIVSLSFSYPSLRMRLVKKKKRKKGTDRRGRVCIIHTWVQDIRGGSNIISLVYPPVRAPFIPFTSLPWRGYFALFNISSLSLSLSFSLRAFDRKIPSMHRLYTTLGRFVNRYPISEEIRVVVRGARLSFLSFVIVPPRFAPLFGGIGSVTVSTLLISPIPRNIHTR